MKYQEAVSKRIIELCTEKQITIKELAITTQTSISTLENLINKEIDNLSINTIQKICTSLNIKLKDFFDSDLFDLKNIKK